MKMAIGVIGLLLLLGGCGEKEGIVKWSDCREQIFVEEGSFNAMSKTYICHYAKTRQGRSMGGVCIHIEYEGGQCRTAYINYKKQDNVCLDKANPRLGEDDLCYPSN
jgi:hypothetical protein